MAYNTNPFLERMSERTTSDLDFVRLFSPKIFEKLEDDAFDGGVHIFRSAPGAGKTTLLRAFTPTALHGFWNRRSSPELTEAFQKLVSRGVLDEQNRPQFLGVLLSCASGYADLPPGADIKHEGLFRALLDCRIVLRTLRSVGSLLGFNTPEQLDTIRLEYDGLADDIKGIPRLPSALELANWAEQHEQRVYAQLDAFMGQSTADMPMHLQFEGTLWLQAVRFVVQGREVATKRLLMIDDLHKLRRKQRELLIDELTVQRPTIPIWLAERSIALGNSLLSQGIRQGREIREYTLEEMWSGQKGRQFATFAQNILDRRMAMQDVVDSRSFSQCLRGELVIDEIISEVDRGIKKFREGMQQLESNPRYREWLARAEQRSSEASIEAMVELYVTRILMYRDLSKRQISLDLSLSTEEFEDRDNSQVRGAAEIFMHDELKIPYYFGLDRLCVMASSNIEELLTLAAALYAGMQNKQVLRKPEPTLSPAEQEKLIKEAVKRKRDFIPKNHTEGLRAQRLLDSIGVFCREKTFVLNAPYAPGVTGVRLSQTELNKVDSASKARAEKSALLLRVLAECAAENLLVAKSSAASTSRESGTVFYLNRTLCVHYGLPLQQGGWQDVSVTDLIDWMDRGLTPSRKRRLEMT